MSTDSALEPIARPLRFAARRGFKNLSVLKGLERTLRAAIDRLPASALSSQQTEALRGLIDGFDASPTQEQARRAKAILALVDEGSPVDEPPPSEPPPAAPTRREAQRGLARMRQEPRPSRGFLDELSLENVKGVGPKTVERLSQRGVDSVLDALLFLPRAYEDRRRVVPIRELEVGAHAVVQGEVLQATVTRAGRRPMFELVVSDGTGTISCRWFRFHKASMEKRFVRGLAVTLSGTVTAWGAMRQMVHPEVETGEASTSIGRVLPIYPEVEGVPAKSLRKILQNIAKTYAQRVDDPLPETLRQRIELPKLALAIEHAHLPDELEGSGPEQAVIRRLIFDELFFLQLALARRRHGSEQEAGLVHAAKQPWLEIAERVLPYSLTGAQRSALAEIVDDLAAPRPMNRLLQGDVGSGKTAVAMVASAVVRDAGRQTALLAPTEILATQHLATASATLGAHGYRIELLTGSTRSKERRAILERLSAGEVDVLIGTHAILEADVIFSDLGLSIVDEQHRFGVEQRASLRAKARSTPPDVLVMTATPIPRTMALTLYGDLRVSVMKERPPGRKPVTTRVFRDEERKAAYQIVESALERGEQAYVVFPLVEATESSGDLKAATKAVAGLAKRFPKHRVELLHGRMKSEEKAEVMARFRSGDSQLLVSTTVIEVGVDVPSSTVLVLENAERFGLSQVHQLRGRVGRGDRAGHCLLIVAGGGQEAWQRLGILEATEDGFEIAEADLRFRGPGEILGTRQSGLPMLMMADLVRDASVLELARKEAFALIESDPDLEREEHAVLRSEVGRRLSGMMGFVDVS